MEIYYMDGGPFETGGVNSGKGIKVLGYDPGTSTFLALRLTGETFWGSAANFDPPPPIPAAARKPQIGEVWMIRLDVPVLIACEDRRGSLLGVYLAGESCWRCREEFLRPATPAEAEPFRPIFEGLKRSLGE